jgi:hypothetical protein
MREFVYGVNDNKFLPKNVSLEDLWTFARQFDTNCDGMIRREEYTDFINKIEPQKEPKHTCFHCMFPDTFIFNEGVLTSWWSPGPQTCKVSEPAGWECINAVMKGTWEALPAHSKYTKRGGMKNWAVQWHIEEKEFRAKVLNHQDFTMLSKKPAAELKSTVAIQAFVYSETPGVMYKCFYSSGQGGRAASAHVMRYSRVSQTDTSIEASSSQASAGSHKPGLPIYHKRASVLAACAHPATEAGSRMQSLTSKFVHVFEAHEGKKVARCEMCASCCTHVLPANEPQIARMLTYAP